MDSKQIVKNGVLMAKLTEYFSANPDKESVVIRAETGGPQKTFWRAVRQESNRFKITEVNTVSDSYVFELNGIQESAYQDLLDAFLDATTQEHDPARIQRAARVMQTKFAQLKSPEEQARANNLLAAISAVSSANRAVAATRKSSALGRQIGAKESKIREAPQAVSPNARKASTIFMQAMSSFDHNQMSSALRQINALLPGVQDPQDRENMGKMIGALTGAVDNSTAGGGSPITLQKRPVVSPQAQANNPIINKAHKIVTGAPPKAKLLATESAEFVAASSEFTAALTPPFSHDKLQRAYIKVNMLRRKVTDPDEQYNLNLMSRELSRLSDDVKSARPSKPDATALNTGRSHFGKRLREDQKKKRAVKS